MEPDAKYTLVGTSVLVLLALITATLLWLLAAGQRHEVESYRIYFMRQSLEGLQVRSDVRMKGIRVGAVTGFSFSKRRPGAVEVVIGVDPSTPVRQTTQAVVDRNLVTGLATIRLLNPDETSPLAVEAPPGEPDVVIAEGASQLQEITDTISSFAQTADETMKKINAILSPQNRAALVETLGHLRSIAGKVDGLASQLDTTLAATGQVAQSLRATSDGLRGDVHRLADRYDSLGAQTTASLREVQGTVGKLGADVSQLSARTDVLLTDSDVELRLTGQQLRATADALSATARRYDDPRALLFGPSPDSLGPGEGAR